MRAYLDKLVATGIYGKNRAEAAERLIAATVERLLREGVLLRPVRTGSDGYRRQLADQRSLGSEV